MSVSSVGSTCSVGFKGQAVNLEQALDSTIRDLQSHLNLVQCHLRSIAATVEQDDDFSVELDLTGKMDDVLRSMTWLFDDLRQMAADLISVPETSEEKAQLKIWKVQRKELEKKLQAEHVIKIREERAASKLALKMEKAWENPKRWKSEPSGMQNVILRFWCAKC